MIEVENTDVNIVRNLIPMRNHMPASAYGLKAISDWFRKSFGINIIILYHLILVVKDLNSLSLVSIGIDEPDEPNHNIDFSCGRWTQI